MTAAGNDETESTWTRLTRRKVVQWGVAYAAGAWGLLQGVQFLAEAFEWPTRVLKLATVALLVGLPVVLVLAWYHGDRGEQRVRRAELAAIAFLLLFGGGLFWWYAGATRALPPRPDASIAARAAAPSTAAAIAGAGPSIAVLPFENRSDQHSDAYFVDGIHDDILTQLTKIGAMKVIARTSSEQFRETKLTTREIGERLGVNRVLEGGVQRAGDRVRITVQLIDTTTDAHLWAETYDRELTAANIFAIQSEVATSIAAALNATLSPAERSRVNVISTHSLKAWESYQLGQQRMASRNSEGLVEAERYFVAAIELDPQFAVAYAALAKALLLQAFYGGASRVDMLARAEREVGKALAIDPNLGEAWAASALAASWRGQSGEAEQMFKRAIALDPNGASVNQAYSELLADAPGRIEDALAHARRAAELDPLAPVTHLQLSSLLDTAGRFDEASERARRALAVDPGFVPGYVELGNLSAYAFNRLDLAVPMLEQAARLDPGNPGPVFFKAMVLLDLGETEQAQDLMQRARKQWQDVAEIDATWAMVAATKGQQAEVGRCAKTALEHDARNREALLLLAHADLVAGQPRLAYERYSRVFPELAGNSARTSIGRYNYAPAIELAAILQRLHDDERAANLLAGASELVRQVPRLGWQGSGIADARIHAIAGRRAEALAALRQAEAAGWRGPNWQYARDLDPSLASIRNEPEFKAVFADIEQDIARQRAAFRARPNPG